MRIRPDVEVLRPAAEDQVPDAAADEIRDVVVLLEPVQDAQRVRIDVTSRNRMALAGNNDRLWHEC